MYKYFNVMNICLYMFILSGCVNETNSTLSPPPETKWVNVEVKNPSPYTKPFPLEVTYISHKCQKKRISGFDGSLVKEPSYKGIQIPLQQQEGSDIWQGKVAMSGGGTCGWTLSKFNLGIEYIDATHLGKELVPGTAVGATIAFDDDASRNGQFTSFYGDIKLEPKYYPYIRERNISYRTKELSLLGKESFLSYRAFNSERIIFSPDLDESKVVKNIEPMKKEKGVYTKIIYPDGSMVSDGTVFPDFEKVDKMKIR
ncbi:hypothetical protein [Chimaeribacter arupi]|uniref:hypothetical protein n=1 Tax=Chimaeribacter arupi TaxID=2060066 RepID=UPI000C7B0A4E|nr:hypothetical protein [Chimaeribacter arupi]PLR45978.1 hypothetical protein CYR52_16070 [Chimaeribacter arupi]